MTDAAYADDADGENCLDDAIKVLFTLLRSPDGLLVFDLINS